MSLLEDSGYICLDTQAFDAAIEKKPRLIASYNELTEDYDRVIGELKKNWKGQGADAFFRDAETVRRNIVGIFDVLKIMCDTLSDCKEVFGECDTALGNNNRDPEKKTD